MIIAFLSFPGGFHTTRCRGASSSGKARSELVKKPGHASLGLDGTSEKHTYRESNARQPRHREHCPEASVLQIGQCVP